MPANPSLTLAELFSHWTKVRTVLLETIDRFEEDELTLAPFSASRPVGQIMLHIGDAEEGWFRYVVRRDLEQWPEYPLESYPTREAIKELLDQIHARTEKYLATLALADLDRTIEAPWGQDTFRLGWVIWHVIEHEIHHRGELSLVLGMLGREGLNVF